MDKQIVIYTTMEYYSPKKESTCYKADEPKNTLNESRAQKATYCLIPFIWNNQNRQIYWQKAD